MTQQNKTPLEKKMDSIEEMDENIMWISVNKTYGSSKQIQVTMRENAPVPKDVHKEIVDMGFEPMSDSPGEASTTKARMAHMYDDVKYS